MLQNCRVNPGCEIQIEGVITASGQRRQFYQPLVSGSLENRDNVPERRRTSCDKCDALDP